MKQDKGPPRSDKFLSGSHFIKILRVGIQLESKPFLLSRRLNYMEGKLAGSLGSLQKAENHAGDSAHLSCQHSAECQNLSLDIVPYTVRKLNKKTTWKLTLRSGVKHQRVPCMLPRTDFYNLTFLYSQAELFPLSD